MKDRTHQQTHQKRTPQAGSSSHEQSLKHPTSSAKKEQTEALQPVATTHDGDPVWHTAYDPRHPHEPYMNTHGVVIGDHHYDSDHSPLNHWSDAIDPLIMAGEAWVHPTNDIGWRTPENQALLAEGDIPGEGPFTHPMEDVSADVDAHALTPAEHHALNQLISRASAKKQKN